MAGKLRGHPDQEHDQPHRPQPGDRPGARPARDRRTRVEVADNAATRGMVRQVRFLVSVEEIADGAEDAAAGKRRHAAREKRMKLHDLRPADGSQTARTRVGRGIAAGKGKTAGRGTKGQKARAGGSIPPWFEGGQTPLHMRIPKLRGFKNRFKVEYEVVNLGGIGAAREPRRVRERATPGARPAARARRGAPITVNQEILRAVGLVRTLDKPLKILGDGERRRRRCSWSPTRSPRRAAHEDRGGRWHRVRCSRSRPSRCRRSGRESSRTPAGDAEAARRRRRLADAPTTTREADTAAAGAEAGKPHARRRPRRPRPRTSRGRGSRAPTATCEGRRHRAGGRPPTPRRRGRADRARSRPPTTRHLRDDDRPGRRRRLTRVRIAAQRLPGAGHPAPDPVRPRDPDRLPVPGRTCRSRASTGTSSPRSSSGNPLFGLLDLFSGGGLSSFSIVGAGREPVHQRLDHHAADDRASSPRSRR